VVAWVCLKNLLQTIAELARAVARLVAHPARARQGWRWTTIKIGFSLRVRGFFSWRSPATSTPRPLSCT